MRSTSERQEGIGQNAVICNYKYSEIAPVINNLPAYEIAPKWLEVSPSRIIVDHLVK